MCSLFDISVANTFFKPSMRSKLAWMQPRALLIYSFPDFGISLIELILRVSVAFVTRKTQLTWDSHSVSSKKRASSHTTYSNVWAARSATFHSCSVAREHAGGSPLRRLKFTIFQLAEEFNRAVSWPHSVQHLLFGSPRPCFPRGRQSHAPHSQLWRIV